RRGPPRPPTWPPDCRRPPVPAAERAYGRWTLREVQLAESLTPYAGGEKILPGIAYSPFLVRQQMRTPRWQRRRRRLSIVEGPLSDCRVDEAVLLNQRIFMLLPDLLFDDLKDLLPLPPLCDTVRQNGMELAFAAHWGCGLRLRPSLSPRGGPMNFGQLVNDYNGDCLLRCPWHGYTFNLFANGEIHSPSSRTDLRLRNVPAVERDQLGRLYIGYDQLSKLWFSYTPAEELTKIRFRDTAFNFYRPCSAALLAAPPSTSARLARRCRLLQTSAFSFPTRCQPRPPSGFGFAGTGPLLRPHLVLDFPHLPQGTPPLLYGPLPVSDLPLRPPLTATSGFGFAAPAASRPRAHGTFRFSDLPHRPPLPATSGLDLPHAAASITGHFRFWICRTRPRSSRAPLLYHHFRFGFRAHRPPLLPLPGFAFPRFRRAAPQLRHVLDLANRPAPPSLPPPHLAPDLARPVSSRLAPLARLAGGACRSCYVGWRPLPASSVAFFASLTQPALFPDERDSVLARWNQLQPPKDEDGLVGLTVTKAAHRDLPRPGVKGRAISVARQQAQFDAAY
uniref:Rieske domain-containing protein n=1 Tax=Macrostomum lignano TaxID=282301 RepID=A0A1I8FQA2_9PLAT